MAKKAKKKPPEESKEIFDENASEEGVEKGTDISEVEVSEEENKSDETVTIPLTDYASQLEEIDHLNQKADEFSEGWQRERAEFTNYRKRMSRDVDLQKVNFKVEIIKKYLTIRDDLNRALKNLPESLNEEAWIDGIHLINQKLKSILDGEGIEPIPTEGLAFDPAIHEAISHEDESDVESGFIIEEVQKGYKIGERVIRPSLVRVAK